MNKDHIFREYDIRGVYNTDFDKNFAFSLGKAFPAYLSEDSSGPITVTIGYDARLSSPEIVDALIEGFTSSGAKVFNLGLVTTPMSYFSMFHLNATGGIMVTGSHNPPDYNGFKISKGKSTIFGEEIQKLGRLIKSDASLSGQGSVEEIDIATPYVEKHKKEFGTLKDMPVVLDCGNGAAGSIVRRLYEAVGLKPTILFEEPDGTFPNHHPDPTVEKNTADLKVAVAKEKAVLGIGFDGDADRIGLVDEKGRFVLGDEMMTLIARDILKTTPGATIIGDVKCSDRMYADVEKHGGKAIMWKTGHSLVKNKIKEEKAPFGGELSGHIFFADRNYGYDDAPYAGLRLLEILAKEGRSFSELVSDIPPSFNTPEIRIDTTEEKKVEIVKKMTEHYSKPKEGVTVSMIDGVRISFPDGWALIRSSNTQPVLVMRFESSSEEGLNRIQSEVRSLVDPLL